MALYDTFDGYTRGIADVLRSLAYYKGLGFFGRLDHGKDTIKGAKTRFDDLCGDFRVFSDRVQPSQVGTLYDLLVSTGELLGIKKVRQKLEKDLEDGR